jgi:C4-dicarboxylate transporter DctM subunit
MIAIIICAALLFGRVMTLLQIPQQLTALVVKHEMSAMMFIIVMNLLMLVLGALLETVSIVLLTMPIITPILHALGVDTIWYGVILTVNMTMALVTPPVGMNLYVINGLFPDIKMEEVIRGVTPFIIIMLLFLVVTIAFPQMSLWLPSVMQ